MRILVDADAIPTIIREILFRAVERTGIPMILVANQPLKYPETSLISGIVVPAGPDEADDKIVSLTEPGDLVITADIPLANRVIEKGAYVIDPRGALYTTENIRERLVMRDLMDELRSGGMDTGGPSAFRDRDRQAFANQLDRFLTRYRANLKQDNNQ